MDILQNTNNILSFYTPINFLANFHFWILLIGSVYVLLKSYDKNWTRLSWLTATISFYIGVIVPILIGNLELINVLHKEKRQPVADWIFGREGMYAWYGENLWTMGFFGIAIFLIFYRIFFI